MFMYPYGDSEQLNLSWLLQQWREFQMIIMEAIAPQYDESKTYLSGDLRWYEYVLYRCTEDIDDPEQFNAEHWEKTQLSELI